MIIRHIKNETELLYFQGKFFELAHVNLPMSYLSECSVMGAFDSQGVMIGGWALRLKPPFRSFELFPPDHDEVQQFVKRKGMHNIVELNGVWVEKSIKTTNESFAFWRAVLKDTLDSEKNYVIFGYPSAKVGLHRFYQRLKPQTIYRGNTVTGVPARIAYITPFKIKFFFLRQAPWLLSRHFNLQKRSKAV